MTRTCRECGTRFDYDPERFRGFRPPGLCSKCFAERRRRLVEIEGLVVTVDPALAIVEAGAERFMWRFAGSETTWPHVGDRVQFRRDPLEVAEGGRLPLARHPRVLA